MKTILLLLSFVLIQGVQAQLSIHSETISSQGTVASAEYMTLSSTIGEVCIASESDLMMLMEGFENSEDLAGDSACPGDFDNSGAVNTVDLLLILGGFGCASSCVHDLNGDDVTNTADLLLFLGFFGSVCT